MGINGKVRIQTGDTAAAGEEPDVHGVPPEGLPHGPARGIPLPKEAPQAPGRGKYGAQSGAPGRHAHAPGTGRCHPWAQRSGETLTWLSKHCRHWHTLLLPPQASLSMMRLGQQ